MNDEDTPRLGEIARTLADFRHEFRTFTDQVVRKDVYNAHMASVQLQMDTLKAALHQMLEEKASDRREVRKALFTAIFSVITAVVVMVLQLVIK